MKSAISSDTPVSRPYRSKRLRPCDVCRRRKQSCALTGPPPCTVCHTLGTECTFNDPPSKRQRRKPAPALQDSAALTPSYTDPAPDAFWSLNDAFSVPQGFAAFPTELDPLDQEMMHHNAVYPSHHGFWRAIDSQHDFLAFQESLDQLQSAGQGLTPPLPVEEVAGPLDEGTSGAGTDSPSPDGAALSQGVCSNGNQRVQQSTQTLADVEGFSAQYAGLAGDIDPFLLRSFRFSSEGTLNLFKTHYRQVSVDDGLPVHFRISSNDLVQMPPVEDDRELAKLVPPEVGVRLLVLFMRFVFPTMPVLSRTRMEISTETMVPNPAILDSMPAYLLAAVYASAAVFSRHDPVLCVSQAFTKIPIRDLWALSYRGILQEVHTPRLSVIQAALVYLQMPQRTVHTAAAESPSKWSLMGSIVTLATSVGLHLDCHDWSIPAWEKRLRRRLWWVVYSETTWRSLVVGFPHPIHPDQWNVSALTDTDFIIDDLVCPSEDTNSKHIEDQVPCLFCHRGHDFRFLATLAEIAYSVYSTFYTLKATQTCLGSGQPALQKARPILDALDQWHSSLPLHLHVDSTYQPSTSKNLFHSESGAYLRLAFLTLRILVYRALLRSSVHALGQTRPPRRRARPTTASSTSTTASDEIRSAAVTWVKHALHFTQHLTSRDCNSYWYTWSRMCFSIITNFTVFLLIQSRSSTEGLEIKHLLHQWTTTLREQSVTFDQMHVALYQLDVLLWTGIDKALHCPPHVRSILHQEPTSRR